MRSYQSCLSVFGLLALVACSASSDDLAESRQAIGCDDAPQWAAGVAYSEGAAVKNLGRRYSCKVPGWCQQGGPYEPGLGWAADGAWQDLGACDSGSGGTGGSGGTAGSAGTAGSGGSGAIGGTVGQGGATGGTGGTAGSGSDCGTGGSSGSAGTSGSGGSGGSPQRQCVDEPAPSIYCGSTCTAVANNGPASNRVALTMMGEGFTHEEIASKFAPHVAAFRKHMFDDANESEPYVRYRRFINLYRIDLVSNESGLDDHENNIDVDTPLDGERGCTDFTIGMCQVNWNKAHDAFEAALRNSDVPAPDWRMIALNTPDFCGSTHYPERGNLNVYCPFQPASLDVALHEGGHAWHWLGDTYWTNDETYSGPEPSEVNITADPSGAKWRHWLGYEDPVLGPIGVYEGAHQYPRGIFRPSDFQKMGGPSTGEFCHDPGPPYCPHDAVSREKIILDIYELVRPFDGWLENSSLLTNPAKLWVDVVDCNVVKVDWYVDGSLIAADFGEQFVPSQFGLESGNHFVEARAHDDTEWVRLDRARMQQTVSWNIRID